MTTPHTVTYDLPRHASESTRLNHQHELYTKIIGCLLHPDIFSELEHAATDPKSDVTTRVADVGTGTGIFILEMSEQLPSSVMLTGFDISDAQFPDAGTMPSQCTFKVLNILDDIPDDLRNSFDVIQVRCLVCGLSGKQWQTAAQNILALLKPGGWLQWLEPDLRNTTACQADPLASTARLDRLVKVILTLWSQLGKCGPEVDRLDEIISETGFVDVRRLCFSSDRLPEVRTRIGQVHKNAAIGALAMTAEKDASALGWTPEAVAKFDEECEEDMKDGRVYYRFNVSVTIARKPPQ